MSVIVGALPGCQRTSSAPAKAHASPAKVAHPVSESQLNTVELLPEAVQRLGLETAVVEQRELSRVRPYGAELMLPGGAAVIVSAPVTGTLQIPHGKKFPQPGLKVTVGESLFDLLPMLSPERAVLTPSERIRFAEARNTIEQSRIDAAGHVQQAHVQVEAAEIVLARAERLLREQAGTVRAVDDAKAQLSLAQKTLEAATQRQKLMDGIDLESPETGTVKSLGIAAPLNGQVRTIQVRPGEIVAAGAPLFEIMNTETLWLRVAVYAGEVAEIAAAEPALLIALDGRPEETPIVAQPMELPPTSAPLAAAVDLYFEVDNAAGNFRPGQRLTAQLKLQGSQLQTTLPWSAVIHDIYGGQWVYEQLKAGTFVRRRIEVEWVQDGHAVLKRGPAVGTDVVTAGAAELAGTEFGFAK
ncbi:MAG: efflux RND transporter periplasmic adaptor subunit [Planctomycetaceae bacterium]|nr:efflux RND transporter periplasmic adaptor subunit [Planctomycetaceae bacterium]